jgi:hypothetical protein
VTSATVEAGKSLLWSYISLAKRGILAETSPIARDFPFRPAKSLFQLKPTRYQKKFAFLGFLT